MKRKKHHDTLIAFALLAVAIAPASEVLAQSVQLEFDTELLSLSLTGGPFEIPLASDPGNALGG